MDSSSSEFCSLSQQPWRSGEILHRRERGESRWDREEPGKITW